MAAQHGHGHTPAAWTGVIIAFIGSCLAGGFMVAANTAGFWLGMAIIAVGVVVGGVMKLMGLGQKYEPIQRTGGSIEKPGAHAGV
ncbi:MULTISPECIES: HGxxPAAW family protein [Streptomycetaceae]|jgi:hypothetical protein|uniref:HGxxPAAW family protein n=1 Tax=Streptomycetaceae TaxID=2062 RepID=UPI0030095FD0